MEKNAHPKYRADIDGLRAIAILSVVSYHAFPNWVRGGFVGVDIFFVISGYLISSIIFSSLNEGKFSFTDFYIRRINRIFPALILILLVCLLLGQYVLLPDEYKELNKHVAAGAGFYSNFLLWQEAGYFDVAAETKLLLHLWSLGVEEQFYLLWPSLLYLAWKKKINLLSITILIFLTSFLINIFRVHSNPEATFYLIDTRLWELLVGSLLACAKFLKPDAQDKGNLCNIKAWAGAALIFIAIFGLNKQLEFPGWWALLPTIGTYLVISGGSHAWFNKNILSNRSVVWLGLISYPFYLYHWPLLSYLHIIESGAPALKWRLLAIFTSIILAWITYIIVEKPIRRSNRPEANAGALVIILLIIGFVGFDTANQSRS